MVWFYIFDDLVIGCWKWFRVCFIMVSVVFRVLFFVVFVCFLLSGCYGDGVIEIFR